MKNKFTLSILTLIIICNNAIGDSIKFDTKYLEILKNENKINAGKGKATSSDDKIEIFADSFQYDQNLDLLKANENGSAIIKPKNVLITFDKATYNQKESTLIAKNKVKIIHQDKNLIIQTDEIFYDKIKNLIKSDKTTRVIDEEKNIYTADRFVLEIDKDLLKLINLKYLDSDNNNLKTPLAYINTNTGKLFGKDIVVNFDPKHLNSKNNPRLKGNSIINDTEYAEIDKGIFTTCKKRDGCPPWQISAEKIKHDKKNKIIYYDNALLKVYNIPVMYFPKFFHPDPSVKRQSGFLMPSFQSSSSSDDYLNTPYFLAIAENKDATFSPRFYGKDKLLMQTEYRQVNSHSNHFADFSFFTDRGKNSKNHLFYDLNKNINLENFEDAEIKLKIQNTSNDTYLETSKLQSKIITNQNNLENSLGLSLYSNNLSVNVDTKVYENLDKKKTDRYEYILPKIDLTKKIENKTKLNGDFSFKSQLLVRNYDTNIYEKININDIIFNSDPLIFNNGLYNNYTFLLKNSYSNSQKSTNHKEGENINFAGIFQYDSSLPLIKEDKKYQKILSPRLTLKIAPDHSQNNSNGSSRIDVNNIYSLNRSANSYTTEGGVSIAYGSDYSISNKSNSREVFGLKVANNLRFKENNDLPRINQIGEKTSNFFGEVSYSPNENFITKYNTTTKNNLTDINYENFITEFKINNFVTNFDYLNDNTTNNESSYLTNTTTYKINNDNNLSFSTRKNKTLKLTEYYNLMYQYRNDCLSASIEYNKDYYSDRDLKPEEKMIFKLTIIPLSETSSPNLLK